MKLIIDIPDEVFNIFKKHGIMAFDYLNEYDKDTIARIIAHGTTYNPSGDCISREALKKAFENLASDDYNEPIWYQKTVFETIDNAQAIPLPNEQVAWEQGYEAGLAQGKQDRPKGEWIGDTDHDDTCKCSNCKQLFDTDRLKMVMCDGKYELPPSCPNCGADMRKGGAE